MKEVGLLEIARKDFCYKKEWEELLSKRLKDIAKEIYNDEVDLLIFFEKTGKIFKDSIKNILKKKYKKEIKVISIDPEFFQDVLNINYLAYKKPDNINWIKIQRLFSAVSLAFKNDLKIGVFDEYYKEGNQLKAFKQILENQELRELLCKKIGLKNVEINFNEKRFYTYFISKHNDWSCGPLEYFDNTALEDYILAYFYKNSDLLFNKDDIGLRFKNESAVRTYRETIKELRNLVS